MNNTADTELKLPSTPCPNCGSFRVLHDCDTERALAEVREPAEQQPLNWDEIEQFRHMAEAWKDMPTWGA